MYNPAKISSKRAAPEDLNIQFTVSVINTAMHYIYLQLISVLIYYTLKKIWKQNIHYFSTFTYSDYNLSAFFFCFETWNNWALIMREALWEPLLPLPALRAVMSSNSTAVIGGKGSRDVWGQFEKEFERWGSDWELHWLGLCVPVFSCKRSMKF